MRITGYKILESTLFSLDADQMAKLNLEKTLLNDNSKNRMAQPSCPEPVRYVKGLYGNNGLLETTPLSEMGSNL